MKRFFDGRWFNFLDTKQQKFLGFRVNFENYSDFYWTFIEIFIDEEYYFKTENKTPFIIDCGGNIGLSVLYFKYLYPNARIIVFEALPENADILENNIKNNKLKDVEVVRKAVGSEDGELKIYGDNRAATICKEFNNKQIGEDGVNADKGVTVPIVRLSDYIKENISFLKMDIEGAEGEVFEDLYIRGKMKQIERTTFEYHRFSLKQNKLSTIIEHLEDSGLETTFLIDSHYVPHLTKRDYSHIMVVAKKC